MAPEELVRRFSLERVGASPATLDYQKLDWMNGVYLRGLDPEAYGDRLVEFLATAGGRGARARVRPHSSRRRSSASRSTRSSRAFCSSGPAPQPSDAEILRPTIDVLAALEPFTPESIEAALRALAERLGQKAAAGVPADPRRGHGSTVSPGLFESIEFLGREETLERLRSALWRASA